MPTAAAPQLRFRLLGSEAFVADSSGPLRISAKKNFALLAYLAMSTGGRVNRSVLADLLWGDRGEAQARQNLRQAILTLRRDLGPAYSELLRTEDQFVSLERDAVDVDALRFLDAATGKDPQSRLGCLDISWGPFLDGFSVGSEAFDEWVLAERQRLDALATRTFSELAAELDAAGNSERAILALERLIAIDPGEEERHRRLLTMEARYRGADAALARAKSLAAMLKRELDIEPEPATIALIEDIRRAAAAVHATPVSPAPPAAIRRDARADGGGLSAPPVLGAPLPGKKRPAWQWGIAVGLALLTVSALTFSLVQNRLPVPPGAANAAIPAPLGSDPWLTPALPTQSASLVSAADGRGLIAVAVLPFDHYSEHGKAVAYVAKMLTDDLTNVLSRIPAFRVISRQTSATYRDKRIDTATIGAELGVHYMIEGSVSIRGSVVRLNIDLTNARTRLQVWSTRIERDSAKSSTVYDEIVNGLGRELQIKIGRIESAAISRTPNIHDLIFRGQRAIGMSRHKGEASLHAAQGYFKAALALDPNNPIARNGLANFHALMLLHRYAKDRDEHLARANGILKQLIEQYPSLNEPYATMGMLKTDQGDNQAAMHALERSVVLNPSHAPSYSRLGRVLIRMGSPQQALDLIHYAMRLSPRDPVRPYWFAHAGLAHLELRQYDRAIESYKRTLAVHRKQPQTTMGLMSTYALKGDLAEAHRLLAELQAAYPRLTRETLLRMVSKRRAKTKVFGEGMLLVLNKN